MKKKPIFITIIIFSLTFSLYAQKEPVFCKGRGYRGYVFDTSYIIFKSIKEQQSRIILSCKEIQTAEDILKKGLLDLNSNKLNQLNGCPDIYRKIKKYCRQYFGFINTKGEKIVWINLFWNKDLRDRAKHELISVNDGCSYYWNIEVNLTTITLTNLQINGGG